MTKDGLGSLEWAKFTVRMWCEYRGNLERMLELLSCLNHVPHLTAFSCHRETGEHCHQQFVAKIDSCASSELT